MSFSDRATRLRHGVAPLRAQVMAAHSLAGRGRLIVTLPTGSGKTMLAALPFAAGLLPTKQMLFLTPLRSLTEAQAAALQHGIDQEAASDYLSLPWNVRNQTGSMPEDPLLTASATVCTFDQALSSALSIAFSTSRRRREINAAAVLSAYLVCDEVHLFPRDEALTTLLWLLTHRPDLPFTLMTATLSRPVIAGLADLLSAQVIESLPGEDYETLTLEKRQRTVYWQDHPLQPEQVVSALNMSSDGRTIVVVNTVARAQELGAALRERIGQDQVVILHSRYYPGDRKRIEEKLRRWFGRDRDGDDRRVLVATQVIEAGLDISASRLFSEWAPANALVQRWGRCARWGGDGVVVIAPPAAGDGLPAPYARGDTSPTVLEKTRAWLREYAGERGVVMTDEAERALLDAAHAQDDERWINELNGRLRQQSTAIGEAIADGLYSHAGGLIRRVDSRTVLVHGAPETLDDPLHASGFSLATGTLYGLLTHRAIEDDTEGEDAISFDLPQVSWTLMRPVWDETAERQAGTPARWLPATATDLGREPLFVLNPALVAYDPELGLRLSGGSTPPSFWAKPDVPQPRVPFALYRREIYAVHIERMLAVLDSEPCLWPRFSAVAPAIEAYCEWPDGTLRRLVTAAIVLHDAGKLTNRWQAAIKRYQEAVGQPFEPWLVHTDQRAGFGLSVGPHALAGAACATGVGQALDREVSSYRALAGERYADDEVLPSRVLFTAIARHHGGSLQTTVLSEADRLSPRAISYLAGIARQYGLAGEIVQLPTGVALDVFTVVSRDLNQVGQDAEYLALAVVSRLLRLADGWSQERVIGTEGEMGEGS